MKITWGDIVFVLALLLAIWFAITGMIWGYLAALLIAYPAGLLSLGLWALGKRIDDKKDRYQWVLYILGVGLLLSVVVFLGMWLLG